MKRIITIAFLFTLMAVNVYPATSYSKGNDWTSSREVFKREIKKEFSTGSSPFLSIINRFGDVRIIEGSSSVISFKITITGKAKTQEEAEKIANKINVDFNQSGDKISAETKYQNIKCNNCGHDIQYEVTVPKGTTMKFDCEYGDIKMDNAYKPLNVRLRFGKFYANQVPEATLDIQYGGATIENCEKIKIESGFSKYKLGTIKTLSGSFKYDGISIDDVQSVNAAFEFSNITVEKLYKELTVKGFSYGSLKILGVDESFSKIDIDASFSKINIAMTEMHNFKTTLYCSFGNIKTGGIKFFETSLKKKDAVVGVAGSKSNPSATVKISNSYGNIVLQ